MVKPMPRHNHEILAPHPKYAPRIYSVAGFLRYMVNAKLQSGNEIYFKPHQHPSVQKLEDLSEMPDEVFLTMRAPLGHRPMPYASVSETPDMYVTSCGKDVNIDVYRPAQAELEKEEAIAYPYLEVVGTVMEAINSELSPKAKAKA